MLFMQLGHLVPEYSLCKMDWHQVWVVEKCVWLEGMCVFGGYVWLRCVVDGCGSWMGVSGFGVRVVLE